MRVQEDNDLTAENSNDLILSYTDKLGRHFWSKRTRKIQLRFLCGLEATPFSG